MKICECCKKEFLNHKFTPNQRFCSRFCGGKFRYNEIKNDPKKYKNFLEYHKKKQFERARKRMGLSLDHPKLIREPGQGTIHKEGYKILSIKNHPNAQKKGLILEHVLIMSNHLGRPLYKHENVHHKNGEKADNRIENLELWTTKQPPGQRVEDKIEWCKYFLDLYGYEVIKRD